MKINLIDMFYEPEYTGKNRCGPCTILNLFLAGLFTMGIAHWSHIAGYISFAVSLGLIYFRGYLVPGTPALTKRYLPREILRWFGKEPELETRNGIDEKNLRDGAKTNEPSKSVNEAKDTAEVIEPDQYLLAEGIIKPCEDVEDLCLDDEFKEAWNREIDQLSDSELDATDVISILDIKTSVEEFNIKEYRNAWTIVSDTQRIGRWPSQRALLADVGAARVLYKWSNTWGDMSPMHKGQVLNGIRLFIEKCPGEDESVTMTEETVESCCSSHDVIVISCNESGDRLFEQKIDSV
ncbi:hypothetical protein [Haloferax sp. YSMS24]|uniref:hypothetical protein n=1 Tax=unclassified Haloferax TaxID=2625095 RepID=UPI00398D125B